MPFVSPARRGLKSDQELRRKTMLRAIEVAIEKIEAILYPAAKPSKDEICN
jgi:hypothetical protein